MNYDKSDVYAASNKTFSVFDEASGERQNFTHPRYQIQMAISDVHHQFERSDYDFVSLLADFGGFNDGILLVASSLMFLYSKCMFDKSLAE